MGMENPRPRSSKRKKKKTHFRKRLAQGKGRDALYHNKERISTGKQDVAKVVVTGEKPAGGRRGENNATGKSAGIRGLIRKRRPRKGAVLGDRLGNTNAEREIKHA